MIFILACLALFFFVLGTITMLEFLRRRHGGLQRIADFRALVRGRPPH
jgi:hypothetical protein